MRKLKHRLQFLEKLRKETHLTQECPWARRWSLNAKNILENHLPIILFPEINPEPPDRGY